MFWRKVDPDERKEVVDLLIRLTLASQEIGRGVDKMKVQMAGPEIELAPEPLMASVTDALETVGRVRADTTKSGFWPRLRDEAGARRLVEVRLLREEVFKHQLWRLKSYGDLVAAFKEGREYENLARESNKATTAYESVLKQMNSAMIKLGKRYKISVWEYVQV